MFLMPGWSCYTHGYLFFFDCGPFRDLEEGVMRNRYPPRTKAKLGILFIG